MKVLYRTVYQALVFVFAASSLSAWDYPIVTTKLGIIRGIITRLRGRSVEAYLGIPYAKAPIKDQRFKKPQPVEPWTNVLEATRLPPACPQFVTRPYPWYDEKIPQSEDCLFLNIWVPSVHPKGLCYKRRAVIYWVYGGGFTVGSNSMPIYDGRALSALGNVIVVTVNYRMGVLGFAQSGTEDAPGNAGLYDIIQGLQWVNDHIEAFCGDRNRITLMGESAGSIAVGFLIVSPLAKGLFQRAIMTSGSPANLLAEDNNRNFRLTEKVARLVDCANDSTTLESDPAGVIACMREVEAHSLVIATSSLFPHSTRSFFVQHLDEALPVNPRETVSSGNFSGVDLLIGNTLDEGSFHIIAGKPHVYGFYGDVEFCMSKSDGEKVLKRIFSQLPGLGNLTEYFLGRCAQDNCDDVRRQVYTASGDYSLLCPTVYFAEKTAEQGKEVFYHLFAHRPTTTPWAPWMGVAHFEDVQFVSGQPFIHSRRYSVEEVYLSEAIIKMWTNFAKTGEPGVPWPLYSKENPQVKVIDTSFRGAVTFGPHRQNCDFFRPYFGF